MCVIFLNKMDEVSLWKGSNIFYNVLRFLIVKNEELLDANDAKLYWRTVFHLFAVYHHYFVSLYAINIDLSGSQDKIVTLKIYRAGFITGWNFAFQTLFLTISLVYDVAEWLDRHETGLAKKLKYYRDVIFSGLVLPFTLFISCMFWTIYWIDRELVFPQVYDQVVPWWFNHCVHTNIAIVVLVETLLQPRRHPTNQKLELTFTTIVNVGYAIVYYCIYFFSHRWLYEVFGIMTWWQVCLYQTLIWGSTYFFYYLQFPVNRIFHKEPSVEQKNITNQINSESEKNATDNGGKDLKRIAKEDHVENSSL